MKAEQKELPNFDRDSVLQRLSPEQRLDVYSRRIKRSLRTSRQEPFFEGDITPEDTLLSYWKRVRQIED